MIWHTSFGKLPFNGVRICYSHTLAGTVASLGCVGEASTVDLVQDSKSLNENILRELRFDFTDHNLINKLLLQTQLFLSI